MTNFVQTIQNIFKIEELKNRILFTIGILLVVRIGAHITLPGIDVQALAISNASDSNTLFGMFDMFVGGAFSNAAIFALGIMPYITSSIVFQMAGVVIPSIQKIQKEGEEGRRKINQWTRMFTVVICLFNAWGVAIKLSHQQAGGGIPVVPDAGPLFILSTIFLLTAGTVFMMWLGEQITERGLGNGISLIIMIGIIARFPDAIWQEWLLVTTGSRHWIVEIVAIILLVAIIAIIIMVSQGTRRIPVQYAKRQIGRKTVSGTTQYLPLKVNAAGVMPIIFAQTLMFIPNTILYFFPQSEFLVTASRLLQHDSWFYALVYFFMIVGFTYFYTAIIFNPRDMADNMKKQGGFIPGVRPGQHTSDYIEYALTRITLPGAIFLGIIAILPTFVTNIFGIGMNFAQFFGGTSILILVGVALDSLSQIESHLLMRHYDGFMKSGRIRGRAGN
jgi:preprotein translocase subunit SecY